MRSQPYRKIQIKIVTLYFNMLSSLFIVASRCSRFFLLFIHLQSICTITKDHFNDNYIIFNPSYVSFEGLPALVVAISMGFTKAKGYGTPQ